MRLPVRERELLDELAGVAVSTASSRSAGISISTLKWPVLQDRAVLHQLHVLPRDDVLVAGRGQKMSPTSAASAIVMTSKPSIIASSARSGSTSVMITCAPCPRAREATPRPTQP